MNDFNPQQPGIRVSQISNPGCRGITTGNIRRSGTRTYIEIETEINNRTFIEADDLELLDIGISPSKMILSKKFGKLGDLSRILTFHKISSDLSNVFYAMQASRTDFYAYQFKPVYKFIESLNGRLLITDEVGLGKTIEAGLIWTELRARTDARRLLIVCPSMLLDKWKKELRDRFNIDANIHTSQSLKDLIKTFLAEGDNFHCNALCSLQTIRQDTIRELLTSLDDKQYKFDLIIIDEAHHLRNIGTQSHTIGRKLSDLSNSMVLLTATPIHLRNEDLFRLLSILDSDEFGQQMDFNYRLEQNAPVIRAQNAIRAYPANIEAALKEIRTIQKHSWFDQNPLVKLLIARLERMNPTDIDSIVEAGRLIENINLFGSIISRTRKREVQEWRVIRNPIVHQVTLSDKETEFYNNVTTAVINAVSSWRGSEATSFSLMMPQRQMASSIPAMISHYSEHSSSPVKFEVDLLTESGLFGIDDLPTEESPAELIPRIRKIISEWDRNTPDTKFTKFKEIVRELLRPDNGVKIVVFSYFKKTLEYLKNQLASSNIDALVIHGDIPMDERQERITAFRESNEVNILLSSEVGSEGIDLQFSNVLINYDLPWNPMKIEQRIGRLDRLGQQSATIRIINFAVKGTIEEKILTKLYDRIEIFKYCLGDLEPILGKLIQELTSSLLSQKLTPEQIESRIDQTERAIIEKRRQENELVEKADILFDSSDYILEQIGQARKLGRWITPEDLKSFVIDFFDSNYKDATIQWDRPENGLLTIKLPNLARNDLHQFTKNKSPVMMTELTQFDRQSSILAFRNEAAQRNPRREMLTHFHPLVQWIVHRHKNNQFAFTPTAAVEMVSNIVNEGVYLIAIQFWKFSGLRSEVQMAAAITPADDKENMINSSAEEVIQELLRNGQTWELAYQQVEKNDLRKGLDRVENQLLDNFQKAFDMFQCKNQATFQRQRANLISYRTRKEEEWQKRLATLRSNSGKTGQIRGFESALQKHLAECERRIEQLTMTSHPSQQFSEIAIILCKVINN